jgi:hypothetical protein
MVIPQAQISTGCKMSNALRAYLHVLILFAQLRCHKREGPAVLLQSEVPKSVVLGREPEIGEFDRRNIVLILD